jgi:hypothetical protein
VLQRTHACAGTSSCSGCTCTWQQSAAACDQPGSALHATLRAHAGAEDAHTGKTNADKVLRFLQDSIHAKGVLVQKLALKNTSAKAAIAKLEAQLAHQEDMGEVWCFWCRGCRSRWCVGALSVLLRQTPHVHLGACTPRPHKRTCTGAAPGGL